MPRASPPTRRSSAGIGQGKGNTAPATVETAEEREAA